MTTQTISSSELWSESFSPSTSESRRQVGEAVIQIPTAHEPGELILSSTAKAAPPSLIRIPRVPIAPARAESRHFNEKERWEGMVTGIDEAGVYASLSRRYQDFPSEEAFIPWEEFEEMDRDLAKEGATFQLKVGYLISKGQTLSVTRIEFVAAPNFTQKEKMVAAKKAEKFASLFAE